VVVDNMHQRKQRMAEEADAFIALPGGLGTFEELFEVWTWHHLGYHSKPIGLLNVAGFYQPLLDFMAAAHSQGFVDASQQQALTVDDTPPVCWTASQPAPACRDSTAPRTTPPSEAATSDRVRVGLAGADAHHLLHRR
jgi:uncharacterized protein (TIGR00730 family)